MQQRALWTTNFLPIPVDVSEYGSVLMEMHRLLPLKINSLLGCLMTLAQCPVSRQQSLQRRRQRSEGRTPAASRLSCCGEPSSFRSSPDVLKIADIPKLGQTDSLDPAGCILPRWPRAAAYFAGMSYLNLLVISS